MNDYWFFLSYARLDKDEYLKKFYEELNERVRHLAGLTEDKVGFFDGESIPSGGEWPKALADGVQASRVFVSLYSPSYFNSEYCGKEWQAFRRRIDEDQTAGAPAPLMVPILWTPEDSLPSPLPEAVFGIQYKDDDFGDIYAEEGLRQLMTLKKYEDNYGEFLAKFARKIIKAARAHSLPALKNFPPLKEIQSAFHRVNPLGQAQVGTEPPVVPQKKGPRYVRFVLVAGTKEELGRVRKTLDFYGDNGGDDWRPYWKEFPEELIQEAQMVAAKEGFITQVERADDQIVELINEARLNNNIVVIMVDTWTLKLSSYQELVRKYDGYSFFNCVLMIPWNHKDSETMESMVDLIKVIRATFQNKAIYRDPDDLLKGINSTDQFCLLEGITSWDELKAALSNNLNLVRRRISETAECFREPAGGSPSIPNMSGRKVANGR